MPTIVLQPSGPVNERSIATLIGAIGLVIIISGLVARFVERGPFTQVIVFIALGVILGPHGLRVFDLAYDAPATIAAGTIALALIFFTDAMDLNLGQIRQHWLLPALALGPGAVLTILGTGFAAGLLFSLPWAVTLLVATVLASTDAVLLRDVVNDRRVPRAVRHTLTIEAGTNDVVVLPLMLLLTAIAAGSSRTLWGWIGLGIRVYVLGPLVGVVIAYIAIRLMVALRKRDLVRRDYESLYSIGVAFVAFAAAHIAGGSGFLAAFAAGLTIALMDEELCDCFLEYGKTTAEMAMLTTFVLLGPALVEAAFDSLGWRTLVFALIVLLVARPVAFLLVLSRSSASWPGRLMLAWFGPRGLNTLLLTVLAIAAGAPHAADIFGIVAVVVCGSIMIHGVSSTPIISWYSKRVHQASLPEETAVDAATLLQVGGDASRLSTVQRITPAAVKLALEAGEPLTILDVRRASAWQSSGQRIPGSQHIPIDEIEERLDELPRDRPVVVLCS